jgi:nucleotide-binding universal stress UspA family protein
MYKKVLLAIDGSETSMKAARVANSYLEQGMAEELTIVNVSLSVETFNYIGFDISIGDSVVNDAEKIVAASKESGEAILEKAKAVMTSPDKVKTVHAHGDIAHTIVKMAEDYDLIIMGSRGFSTIAGLVMGSVSSKVVHYANCQVLIVK